MKTKSDKKGTVLQAPEYAPVKENEQVLWSLGITPDHIAALPMIVNTGTAFLVLEVRNKEVLQSLRPVAIPLRLLLEQYGLAGYCVFCRHTGGQADATACIFTASPQEPASLYQVPAAGALACYLYDIVMIKKEEMVISLGYCPRPDVMTRLVVHLHLQEGKIFSLQPVADEPVH
ncbi:PhzF family phenazine biosynthesis protein [Pseudoflavitalea sp. X16]|uniref:PhzF family phenazine biosynthesis protein n=1 Tax=Paraflavitalea devenefica TaxID=2716334 RepID=UPI001422617C|nr:PhzF family phenazine biosynthesis protein [Paraflavitalea devenefica]NII27241.1 PhzF family phenazine biosynthesis protein [Paraflavitalea devenefica]